LPDVINTVCQMVEVETSKASGSNGHVPMELGAINYHRGRSPSPGRGGGQGASNQQWGGQNRDPSRGRSPGREQQQQQQKPKLWPDPRKDSRWPEACKRSDAEMLELKAAKKCFCCKQTGHPWYKCKEYPKGGGSKQ
jgi:hypothetical protein